MERQSATRIGASRAAALLLALALVRVVNCVRVVVPFAARRRARNVRWDATWLSAAAFGCFLEFVAVRIAARLVEGVAAGAREHQLLAILSSAFSALWLAAFCGSLGLSNRDVGKPANEREWLFSALPISPAALRIVEVARDALFQPFAWVLVFSFLMALALRSGPSVLGAVALSSGTLGCFVVLAVWKRVAEAVLRTALRPPARATVQFLSSTLASVAFAVAVGELSFGAVPEPFAHLLGAIAQKAGWFPGAELVRVLVDPPRSSAALATCVVVALIQFSVACGGGIALLALVRRSDRNTPQGWRGARGARPTTRAFALSPRVSIVAKDLHWLWRDKSAFAEVLLLSAVALAHVSVVDHAWPGWLAAEPARLAAAVFACGMFVIASVGVCAFRAESDAAWVLFTLPTPLSRVLFQKALSCFVLASSCALGVLVMEARALSRELVAFVAFAMTGLAVYSCMVVARAGQRFAKTRSVDAASRIAGFYEALILASPYFAAFFAGSAWQALQSVCIALALTNAFWRRCAAHLQRAFDPGATHWGARIELSDGLLGALAFSIVDGLAVRIAQSSFALARVQAEALAFALAGVLTMAAVFCALRARGVRDPAGAIGLGAARGSRASMRAIVVWGSLAVGVAVLSGALGRAFSHGGASGGRPMSLPALTVLLLLAPFVEEVLFRGLVHRALRARFERVPATFSSAFLFAALHPSHAAVPVFFVGVCAALALEASGSLLPAIVVHAAYNLAVLLVAHVG